jgi:hypothetical protein
MIRITLSAAIAFFLSGSMSAFSVLVDGRPDHTAKDLSDIVSRHYATLGFEERTGRSNPDFVLGEWSSQLIGGRFIGHGIIDGVLWIWVVPAPGSDDVRTVVSSIEKIVARDAAGAVVQVRESRSLDFR